MEEIIIKKKQRQNKGKKKGKANLSLVYKNVFIEL